MKYSIWRKALGCITVGTLAIGCLSGCGSSKQEEKQPAPSTASQSVQAGTSQTSAQVEQTEPVKTGYPIEGDVKLTFSTHVETDITANYPNRESTPFGQAWQEATGVTVETMMLTPEQTNLMLASGELPDIVYFTFSTDYPGGVAGALADGIAVPINDYLEYAPDLKALLDSNEEYRKAVTSENGEIYGFPFIRADERSLTYVGLIARQDWLDELGLEQPQTPDELYEVLKVFKEKKGVEVPFSMTEGRLKDYGVGQGILTSGFGLPQGDFYQENGQVHYGYAEPEYKDVLTWLNKLYSEGLLDPNFQTLDNNAVDANIMNGDAGVVIQYGSRLESYMLKMAGSDPEFEVSGLAPLVEKEGDIPMSNHREKSVTGWYAVITPNCKNPEAAARFLNYGYTEEGIMLMNYGIEGESYEVVDGVPRYTEFITKNPNGWSPQTARAGYMIVGSFPMVQQYVPSEVEQKEEGLAKWAINQAKDYKLPTLSMSADDLAEYSKLMGDISTYVSEMFVKYVTGVEPLDTFETTYLPTLQGMKLDRAIEIQNNALAAYNAR